MSQLLELHGIRKSFGENLVLDDISLAFPQGSATVIIGASGSGKSTLVKKVFSQKPYVSLENPDERMLAEQDPRSFLNRYA